MAMLLRKPPGLLSIIPFLLFLRLVAVLRRLVDEREHVQAVLVVLVGVVPHARQALAHLGVQVVGAGGELGLVAEERLDRSDPLYGRRLLLLEEGLQRRQRGGSRRRGGRRTGSTGSGHAVAGPEICSVKKFVGAKTCAAKT